MENGMEVKQSDIIRYQKKIRDNIDINIRGYSMNPLLQEGDVANIKFHEKYSVGDIIIFDYEDEGVLIHRIIKIENGSYVCKGDNAFRIEVVPDIKILGKATSIKRDNYEMKLCNINKITLLVICNISYRIYKQFIKENYNAEGCRNSTKYKLLQFLLKK